MHGVGSVLLPPGLCVTEENKFAGSPRVFLSQRPEALEISFPAPVGVIIHVDEFKVQTLL